MKNFTNILIRNVLIAVALGLTVTGGVYLIEYLNSIGWGGYHYTIVAILGFILVITAAESSDSDNNEATGGMSDI